MILSHAFADIFCAVEGQLLKWIVLITRGGISTRIWVNMVDSGYTLSPTCQRGKIQNIAKMEKGWTGQAGRMTPIMYVKCIKPSELFRANFICKINFTYKGNVRCQNFTKRI